MAEEWRSRQRPLRRLHRQERGRCQGQLQGGDRRGSYFNQGTEPSARMACRLLRGKHRRPGRIQHRDRLQALALQICEQCGLGAKYRHRLPSWTRQPVVGLHKHDVDTREFLAAFDNRLATNPYKILFGEGDYTCSVVDWTVTMKG